MKHGTIITVGIALGLVLGALVGEVIFRVTYDEALQASQVPPVLAATLQFIGDTCFIGLLKMIVLPLVAASVVVGVTSIGDPRELGRIGGLTLLYYALGMTAAVILGLVLVTTIRPGVGISSAIVEQGLASYTADATVQQRTTAAGEMGLWGAVQNITRQLIPANIFGAAAEGQVLPVISFSLIVGVALATVGAAARPLIDAVNALYLAVMKLVDWILWLAPLGVFCIVTLVVARAGLAQLVGPLALYMLTVILALLIHGLVTLPLALWLLGRANPYRYMGQVKDALLMAFGTASSNATLPVSIEVSQKYGGVSRRASGFVMPLGATVNMNGTALYEAVAVVFLFQCFGIPLGLTELLIITVTATLAAVGAAGIPSAGLVTMVLVVEAVNNSLGLPPEQRLPLASVGIILGVDRILDMCRTTVNVWDDLVGAKIITRLMPDEPAAAVDDASI